MSQSDAVSLRMLLGRLDGTAPAIQQAAAAMMKHYDKSAGVAVMEWRNCLQNCRHDQLLPLMYVANEVLQNSKRNRGNKFLEAFSPVLGQSIVYMVQRDSTLVEKIRRTIKIWGDRRVLSLRFVNQLLHGLEPFRGGDGTTSSGSRTTTLADDHYPTRGDTIPKKSTPKVPDEESSTHAVMTSPSTDDTAHMTIDLETDDNNNHIDLTKHDSVHDDEDEEEQDEDAEVEDLDVFLRDTSERSGGGLDVMLDVDPNALLLASSQGTTVNQRWLKRRRSSMEGDKASTSLPSEMATMHGTLVRTTSGSQRRRSRRKSINMLSTNALMDLWNQVASLQQSFDYSGAVLSEITPESLSDNGADLDDLVGDKLLEQYRQVLRFQELVGQQRRSLHAIAQERYQLQKEAVRYLPWLEMSLKQDSEDIAFCNELEEKLQLVKGVHGPARRARDERLAEEEIRRAQEEELERRRQEEKERLKFLQSALNKETEAKPGMVWNRATQEYQYLNTEESWRD